MKKIFVFLIVTLLLVSMVAASYGPAVAPTSSSSSSTTTTSSGGSSGGSGGGAAGGSTFVVNGDQLKAGYSKSLGLGDRFKVTIEDELHYITLNETFSNRVKVIVKSDPQEAVIYSTKTAYFELTGDSYLDLSVGVESINSTGNTATLIVKGEHMLVGEIPEDAAVVEGAVEEEVVAGTAEEALGDALVNEEGIMGNQIWIWLFGILMAVLAIVAVSYFMNHKKKSKAVIRKK